ncbi:MAG: TDP-4-oxo-6-deoxy-D-glucose aminotransferase, partial [Actinobacteria bacterium]|nr:TDP-4-oxo-6-deoxy-D-glucose aminotransferase [Actinomycetota bacterium]
MSSTEIRFNRPDISESDRAFLAEAIAGGHSSGNGVFTRRTEAALQQSLG